MLIRNLFVIAAALASGAAASAETLKIGLSSSVTSMDPQFYVIGSNSAMARNIFDGLVNQDEHQQLKPALAVSWRTLDDTTWEFKLRDGVTFHDGSAFDAEDVAASIRRVPLASTNSPSSFKRYVAAVKEVRVVDHLTVHIVTDSPAPLLLNDLSRIAILPSELEKVSTPDLDKGDKIIGTGPFKFDEWQRDAYIKLSRNDAYWAGPSVWDSVEFRFLSNARSRVAAVMAGDVDVIEQVPSQDLETIKKSGKAQLVTASSNRVMYLHMDHDREISPFAKGPDGKNPLRFQKVRQALSMAINREALVARIMDGEGVPAGQLVPEGYFGYVPELKAPKYDPEAAKKLLAEAGYPDGFTMTSHASNDRYPNDEKIAQAIGQMFARIGLKIDVVTLPKSVYFSRASAREFSFIMGGAAVETGEASGVLGPLLATYDKEKGQGAGNRGRYSSPAFDEAYQTALKTVDAKQRETLLHKAMRIGMEDVGVIPVFFLAYTWGLKDGLEYTGRSDGYTLAYGVTKK